MRTMMRLCALYALVIKMNAATPALRVQLIYLSHKEGFGFW